MSKFVDFVNQKKFSPLIIVGMLVVAFFCIFCFIHYSDGDDAFFAEVTSTRSYFEYLKYRYETWTGRMGGESLVYLVFRLGGIWFWRIVNSLMVVALPLLLLNLSAITRGFCLFNCCCKGNPSQNHLCNWEIIRLLLVVFSGYLLMDVMTFGHSAVWVNGSIFYTWCIVCGLLSVLPAVKYFYGLRFEKWEFAYAIPLGVVAAMSIEQIGAVLFAFVVAVLFGGLLQKKKLNAWLLLQAIAILASMLVLFLAPGNDLRTAISYEEWVPPEFIRLSVGEHLFLTYQWLISSFANEGRLFFLCIWFLGSLLLLQDKNASKRLIWIVPAVIFSVVALLPFVTVCVLSNVGLAYIDPAVKLEVLPSWEAMSFANVAALATWTLATVFTIPFLWKVSKSSMVLLVFAAAIASECVMYFSPTIYASGERVYYMTSLLFIFIMIQFLLKLKSEKMKNLFTVVIVVLGMLNLLTQAAEVVSKLSN